MCVTLYELYDSVLEISPSVLHVYCWIRKQTVLNHGLNVRVSRTVVSKWIRE